MDENLLCPLPCATNKIAPHHLKLTCQLNSRLIQLTPSPWQTRIEQAITVRWCDLDDDDRQFWSLVVI